MDKEKYDPFCIKLMNEENEILKDLQENAISISNLKEKIIKAAQLCSKLLSLWHHSDLAKKEILQKKLVFPEGIYFNKKNQSVRTTKINEVFSLIARLSGDLTIKTKGLNATKSTKSLLAEGGGFEPPVRFPVRQFSKLLVSATHPSLLNCGANVEKDFSYFTKKY
jgi:site-specific DNA recombinase